MKSHGSNFSVLALAIAAQGVLWGCNQDENQNYSHPKTQLQKDRLLTNLT